MAEDENPIEIFMPPNVLKAKVGGDGGLDVSALTRAELALENLKCEFAGWFADDIARLEDAHRAYQARPCARTLSGLYRASHDLRGQATTFGYPLVARIATSLCQLTDESGPMQRLPMPLVDAHVSAIRILVRQAIKDTADETANLLASELEKKVELFLQKYAAA
jgi:hypothetical protein